MTASLTAFLDQLWSHPLWLEPNGLLWANGIMGSFAFAAATILPVASEAVLIPLALKYPSHALELCLSASLGNTLGAITTVWIGRWAATKKAVPAHWQQTRAYQWVHRWGASALLLSWLPVLGDALTLAAGWVRLSWLPVITCIAIGKLARYLVVVLALAA